MAAYLLLAHIQKDLVPGYPDVILVFAFVFLSPTLCMAAIILLFPSLIIPEPTAGAGRQ